MKYRSKRARISQMSFQIYVCSLFFYIISYQFGNLFIALTTCTQRVTIRLYLLNKSLYEPKFKHYKMTMHKLIIVYESTSNIQGTNQIFMYSYDHHV